MLEDRKTHGDGDDLAKQLLLGLGGVTAGLLIILAFTIPVALWMSFWAHLAWNWVMVSIFHLPVLSTLQMWAIVVTCGLIRPFGNDGFLVRQQPDVLWSSTLVGLLIGPPLGAAVAYIIMFWWLGVTV